MIENTISIDSTSEGAENIFSVQEENSTQPQGNDWQNIEEKESMDVEVAGNSPSEQTDEDEGEKIKLTVYGEEIEADFEQIKAAAQKGLAFERLKSQLANAKNNPHLRTMEQIAHSKGTTLASLVADFAHREECDRLEKEYGDLRQVPTEIIAQSVNRLSKLREELNTAQFTQAAEDWRSQLREFAEDNPGEKQIPPEVIETAKHTGSLALAYSDYNVGRLAKELEQTKQELEMLKAEKQSLKGLTPSAASVAATGEGEDDSFRKMMRSTW